jgi:anti-anti-sigma factor
MRLTQVNKPPDRITLVVEGDIDLAVADDLCDAGCNVLLASPTDTLYLDLSGVTFMDSSALNALITIRNAASSPVVLVSPSTTVVRLLQLTALDQAFAIDPGDVPHASASPDDAPASLDGPLNPA